MTDTITLDPADLITQGSERAVYAHPADPTRLVKVIKYRDPATYKANFGDWTKKNFPSVRSRLIYKEYIEYARIMLRYQDPDFVPPISHMYGFVKTTLGLGCVTERVMGEDGKNGLTLRQKSNDDMLSEAELGMVNDLITQLYDLGVRAGDSNPSNLVFGTRQIGPTGAQSPYSCVMVDGFGDFHAIPIRSLSKWTNSLGLDDSFKRMEPKVKLTWNNQKRQFSF